jgi:hypothetical protein
MELAERERAGRSGGVRRGRGRWWVILPVRAKLTLLAVVAALGVGGVLLVLPGLERTVARVQQMAHSRGGLAGAFVQDAVSRPRATRNGRRGGARADGVRGPGPRRRGRGPATAVRSARAGAGGGHGVPAAITGLLIVVGGVCVLVAMATGRRLHRRGRREYARFPLRLSMHDEAKPEDLIDMTEALVDALRPRLGKRTASGQPFCALELAYDGAEWMLCAVCERERVGTLEGILTQAYPDVWLGREFEGERSVAGFRLGVPGHVLRFRKRRTWMLPLSREEERSADRRRRPSSAIEGIARAQVAAASPSIVRLQLIPMAEGFERRMSARLSRWQHRMARSAVQGQQGGLTLSEQQQVASAVAVQGRSLLFLEVQVAAADWETANAIGSSVIARRGENHLHRRCLRVRQGLYRRRFPSATPPWLPSPLGRTIVSSAEIAFLLELPSARMKSVPVRRVTRPRIPRPPEGHKPTAELSQPALTDRPGALPVGPAAPTPSVDGDATVDDAANRAHPHHAASARRERRRPRPAIPRPQKERA